MTLKDKITADLVVAMKARNELKVSTLRMLKAAVMKFEVSGQAKKEANDEEVLTIVGKEVKQRKDSIDAYKNGNREDLAKKETLELEILQSYLPAQMSETEATEVIKKVISETGASSNADFGKVMGAVMTRVKGKADGQVVSKVVREILGR